MTTHRDGEAAERSTGNGPLDIGSPRTLRFDEARGDLAIGELGTPRSGRWFVVALVFLLAAFALALFVAFRQWRSRHDSLADYGANRVAEALRPLADKVPPQLDPDAWARIVEQARRLVVGLTASGTMNIDQMRRLRAEIQELTLAARPETVAGSLESLWSDLERRAGPGLTRAPRFELASTISRLSRLEPPGLERERWLASVVNTRAMLTALAATGQIPTSERRRLRERIEAIVSKSKNETAVHDLHSVWDAVAMSRSIPAGFQRLH
jgi:hypothetical protein